jgi:hypothetical protein
MYNDASVTKSLFFSIGGSCRPLGRYFPIGDVGSIEA